MNWNIWKQIRRASDRANIYPHTGSDLFCNCKENTLCVRRKEKLESWSAHSAMDGSSRKTDLGLELVLTTVVDIQTEQKRCWHDANGALITGFLTCRSFHCCPSHATPRPRPTTEGGWDVSPWEIWIWPKVCFFPVFLKVSVIAHLLWVTLWS